MKPLHEAIADIAYIAGQHGYYSGDSRADIQEFVALAKEFEKWTKNVDWDSEDNEVSYIEAIEIWTKDQLHLQVKLNFCPDQAKSKWDNIEIDACVDDGEDTYVVHDEETPDFYSVYLHQVSGGVQCVADLPTEEDAIALANLLKNAVNSYTDNGYLPKNKEY